MTTTEPELGALFAALAKAQGAIRGAEKDRINPQFRQGYSTLTSVWDACRAELSAHGLCVVQTTYVDGDGHVLLRTTLGHSGGACIESVYPVRPTQDTPQGFGSALTYARRYCLASIVGVAPDDDDGAAASTPVQAPDSKALSARFGSATTTAQLAAAEESVRDVWGRLSDADRKSLTKHRDAARKRLTPPEPTGDREPGEGES